MLCRQDFIQLENETVFNEAVIEEREQGIREIHQQIGEVNEIFKDLAVLVHEQGYMIGTLYNRYHCIACYIALYIVMGYYPLCDLDVVEM